MSKVKTTTTMKATAKKKTTTAKATTTKKATVKPKVKATTKPAAKKKTATAKPKVKATTKKATTTKKAVTKKATTKKATTTKKTTTAKPKVKATTKKAAVTKKATTKKTTTAKPKVKATTKKPAVKRTTSKFKRGYDVKLVNKELTFGGVKDLYEVYEVAGPKVDKMRMFVDEESVLLFIEQNEIENGLNKSFESAIKRTTTKSERKEMQAAKELSDLVPELETIVDANFRDSNAKRPEDTDK